MRSDKPLMNGQLSGNRRKARAEGLAQKISRRLVAVARLGVSSATAQLHLKNRLQRIETKKHFGVRRHNSKGVRTSCGPRSPAMMLADLVLAHANFFCMLRSEKKALMR